jgi:hypothetical protein
MLRAVSPKPWLEEARSTQTTPTTAIKTVKTSPKLGTYVIYFTIASHH